MALSQVTAVLSRIIDVCDEMTGISPLSLSSFHLGQHYNGAAYGLIQNLCCTIYLCYTSALLGQDYTSLDFVHRHST